MLTKLVEVNAEEAKVYKGYYKGLWFEGLKCDYIFDVIANIFISL